MVYTSTEYFQRTGNAPFHEQSICFSLCLRTHVTVASVTVTVVERTAHLVCGWWQKRHPNHDDAEFLGQKTIEGGSLKDQERTKCYGRRRQSLPLLQSDPRKKDWERRFGGIGLRGGDVDRRESAYTFLPPPVLVLPMVSPPSSSSFGIFVLLRLHRRHAGRPRPGALPHKNRSFSKSCKKLQKIVVDSYSELSGAPEFIHFRAWIDGTSS